jgi:hypothetical protein
MPVSKENIRFVLKIEKYGKKKGSKIVRDLKAALGGDADYRIEAAKRYYRVKKELGKTHLTMMQGPQNKVVGYVPSRSYFGNVKGKRGFNAFGEEVRRLVLAGEPIERHKRELNRRFHLPYWIIEDEWAKAQGRLEVLSPAEVEAERTWESLLESGLTKKTSGPTYERSFKRSPRKKWRTLPNEAALDFLSPYYPDPLSLLNQGQILNTPSASYRIARKQKR